MLDLLRIPITSNIIHYYYYYNSPNSQKNCKLSLYPTLSLPSALSRIHEEEKIRLLAEKEKEKEKQKEDKELELMVIKPKEEVKVTEEKPILTDNDKTKFTNHNNQQLHESKQAAVLDTKMSATKIIDNKKSELEVILEDGTTQNNNKATEIGSMKHPFALDKNSNKETETNSLLHEQNINKMKASVELNKKGKINS